MRSAARTAVVAAPALVVVAVAWLRLEDPSAPLWRVLALLALALAAAAPRRRSLRVIAAVAATLLAARIAFGVDLVPWRLTDPGSGFGVGDSLSTLGTRFGNGFSDFYGTHLPFDPRVHTAMAELVLAGVFAFSLLIALLAAARKPVLCALALLVGAGWPATLLGPSRGIAMGAAILAAALVVLAGLGSRRVPALALPAAAVVAALAVAVGSATAARHGLVHWQSWNLANIGSGGQVGMSFAWDAQYGGLSRPAHPTVVLEVAAPNTPTYLRAAVLDDFTGDAWSVGVSRSADSLEPAAAHLPRNQTPEFVTVDGLSDTRLVGGSIPIRFDAGKAPLIQPEPGFASLNQTLPRGFQYTAWSYTTHPTVAELLRSPPHYPSVLSEEGLLSVRRLVTMPAFGTPNREAAVLSLVAHNPDLNPYLPLARLADEVAGGAQTPYGAVARLESWFLSSGRFRYSNHPPLVSPPLVTFVTQTRTGYCQYFAGAMALMLRYLGIPARVAVGFATGTYIEHRQAWFVTDRDAHAWVEVWFKGYGWLPFDPTPAAPGAAPRSTAGGTGAFTAGAGSVPFAGAAKATPPGARSAVENALLRKNGFFGPHGRGTGGEPASLAAGRGGGGGDRGRPALILLLVLAAAGGIIVVAKAGLRMSREVRRDPRGIAGACRESLVSFLVDQRIDVPRSATLAELGGLVQHEFGVNPDGFVAAATAARFGPADRAAAEARRARKELRTLLGGARHSLTWRERLRGLLSLRSLARPPASLGGAAGSTS
jgi:transglutaminase-like putative cysteine protease